MSIKKRLWLFLLIFLTAMIAVYDNTLNFLTADWLATTEENIMCRWIINRLGVDMFITIKAVSTIIVISLMIELVYTKWWIVIPFIFAFQFALFFYLTCYDKMFWCGDMFSPLVWVIDFFVNSA